MKSATRKALLDLAQAIREDWSDFDGRTLRGQVSLILGYEDRDGDDLSLADETELRDHLGLETEGWTP